MSRRKRGSSTKKKSDHVTEKRDEIAKLQKLVAPHPLYRNIPINLQANPHIKNTLIKYDKSQFPKEKDVMRTLNNRFLNLLKPNIQIGTDYLLNQHFYRKLYRGKNKDNGKSAFSQSTTNFYPQRRRYSVNDLASK